MGKELVQDFQRKYLIFPGMFKLQTLFQKPLAAPTVSRSFSLTNKSSQRHLYPDLTENFRSSQLAKPESRIGVENRGAGI